MRSFWEGFEKQAKVKLRDLEHHMGQYLEPGDVDAAQAHLDALNQKSFALQHPILSGIPTLGLWPLLAHSGATDEASARLMRNNPLYQKRQKEEEDLSHKREVELMAKHIAEREAEARENLMRIGSTAALAGIGSMANAHAARNRFDQSWRKEDGEEG